MKTGPQTIYIIAKALEELKENSVFVGGATLPFYLRKGEEADARATEDVDVVLNIIPKTNFHKREEILRSKGFKNDTRARAPLCRWRYGEITVDFLPPEPDESGPSNRWYKQGIEHCKKIKVKDLEINILSKVFFIGTKVEAFLDRGINDPILSHDLEDIIAVLESSSEKPLLAEFLNAPKELNDYLYDFFNRYLKEDSFLASVHGYSNDLADPKKSIDHILSIINSVFVKEKD